jgi:hypothetical protein
VIHIFGCNDYDQRSGFSKKNRAYFACVIERSENVLCRVEFGVFTAVIIRVLSPGIWPYSPVKVKAKQAANSIC